MLKINEMLLKLEVFWYATSLDSSIGYYHIRISKNESNLCTIIIPRGGYCFKRLPMGIYNSPYISNRIRIFFLFREFEFIPAYIYGLFILTRVYWPYHVQNIELTLNKLKEKVLKCNIEKLFFGLTEMEYLGFWVTRVLGHRRWCKTYK